MLPKGTISIIQDFFYTNPEFRNEIKKAMKQFFNRPDLKKGSSIEMEEFSERFFNEWITYDFVLENGQTVLECFCDENPYSLSDIEMQTYCDLRINEFGMWEVLDVCIGKGVKIVNSKTGDVYEVEDRNSSFGLEKGSLFFGRVGKVGDHFEFVSADSFHFPKGSMDERKKNALIKCNLNPKVIHDFFKK